MTKENAEKLIAYWGEDIIDSRYEEFRMMTGQQKKQTIELLKEASRLLGRPGNLWLEKAIVWDVWQRPREHYARTNAFQRF